MRTLNGQYTNRLPQDADSPARQIGKSVGAAALQAVLVVTAARLVDALFTAVANRRRPRDTADTAPRSRRDAVAA